MSDYIEDRITSLENKVSDIERHYNLLHTRVNDLEDGTSVTEDAIHELQDTLGKGVAENNTAIIKTMREVEKIKCEVRGTECLDPLTDKPVDQSTEEFVKVVRCKNCVHWGKWTKSGEHMYCCKVAKNTCEDDYCSRGEKR